MARESEGEYRPNQQYSVDFNPVDSFSESMEALPDVFPFALEGQPGGYSEFSPSGLDSVYDSALGE